jgi:hypothetical protein
MGRATKYHREVRWYFAFKLGKVRYCAQPHRTIAPWRGVFRDGFISGLFSTQGIFLKSPVISENGILLTLPSSLFLVSESLRPLICWTLVNYYLKIQRELPNMSAKMGLCYHVFTVTLGGALSLVRVEIRCDNAEQLEGDSWGCVLCYQFSRTPQALGSSSCSC